MVLCWRIQLGDNASPSWRAASKGDDNLRATVTSTGGMTAD